MRTFKRDGVTLVFVSHNLQAVVELCDDAVYLNRQVRAYGPCAQVINSYVTDALVRSFGGIHEAIARIRALYAVEERARDLSAAERLALRQAESAPLVP